VKGRSRQSKLTGLTQHSLVAQQIPTAGWTQPGKKNVGQSVNYRMHMLQAKPQLSLNLYFCRVPKKLA
jgi:hypothetical protein